METPKIFNGTHTLTSVKTGEWWTFKLKTQPNDSRFHPGRRILSILNGPDNVHNYQQIAFIDGDELSFWRSAKDIIREKAEMFWTILVTNPEINKREWEHLLAGSCIICNRKLTTPESVRSGIGPICANRAITHPDPKIERILKMRARIKRQEVEHVI